MILKALTLWQPWASLMALGLKRIETRSWETLYRGPLVICAARRWWREQHNIADAFYRGHHSIRDAVTEWDFAVNPPLGCAVCILNLIDCQRLGPDGITDFIYPAGWSWRPDGPQKEVLFGDFSAGRFAWLTQEVQPLRDPLPVTGRQRLFNLDVPEDTLDPVLFGDGSAPAAAQENAR